MSNSCRFLVFNILVRIKSFKGKVVVVTGSSSGIRASVALKFTKEGAQIVLVGRNEKKLGAVYERCASFGIIPLLVKVDVTKDDKAKGMIDQTINRFGKLDVLVNNAGVGGVALKLSEQGVRVNVIIPGPVRTDIAGPESNDLMWERAAQNNELKRVSEPEEIADLMLFLASDKAKGITGSVFSVENGSR